MKAASTTTDLRYVLVTPARNEASFIERTLQSVVTQTRLPLRWVIVSDGSTDGTDDIVRKFAELHPWIELIRVAGSEERSFVGKAHAFNTGFKRLRDLPYDVLGNIDADVSFDIEYFAFLLEKFAELPDLGIAGTPYLEGGEQAYDYRFTTIQDVAGCCQLFRRDCLNALGGYLPIDGGMDTIAVITARMLGWKTRTFVEKAAVHHRDIDSARRSRLAASFRQGEKDYLFGNHPVWQAARSIYQLTSKPYLTRGLLLWCGYTYASLRRAERSVSNELLQFLRAEQRQRLMRMVLSPLPMRRLAEPTVHTEDRTAGSRVKRATYRASLHDGRLGEGVRIEGKDIVVTGIWPRTARLRDEWYAFLDTPEDSVRHLRTSGIRADLFTFLQPISDRIPRHPFHLEWCSAAVLPLRTYDRWWNTQINAKTRNMVRKAARSQVHVRCVEFDDDLIHGIRDICNETPLRQGRPFKHFGQDYEAIKRTHITYLEKSEFLGAFFGGELIGFAKLVHGESASGLMHVLCKERHRHRAPANALIASAVAACTKRKVPYLYFGEWSRRGLGEFKKHHAFEPFSVPRYFVPLNATGRFLLGLNLHRELKDRIPDRWQDTFVAWRSRWYTARYGRRVH